MYGMPGVYRAGSNTYVSKTGNSSSSGSTARLANMQMALQQRFIIHDRMEPKIFTLTKAACCEA